MVREWKAGLNSKKVTGWTGRSMESRVRRHEGLAQSKSAQE